MSPFHWEQQFLFLELLLLQFQPWCSSGYHCLLTNPISLITPSSNQSIMIPHLSSFLHSQLIGPDMKQTKERLWKSGNSKIKNVSHTKWRKQCVLEQTEAEMQDQSKGHPGGAQNLHVPFSCMSTLPAILKFSWYQGTLATNSTFCLPNFSILVTKIS